MKTFKALKKEVTEELLTKRIYSQLINLKKESRSNLKIKNKFLTEF